MKAILLTIFFIFISTSFAADGDNNYYVESGSEKKETYQWTMNLKNHKFDISEEATADNPEIQHASVLFESLDENVLHFKIKDKDNERWEAPLLNPEPGKDYKKAPLDNMGVSYTQDPFTIKIVDPKNQDIIIDQSMSVGGTLKFCDKQLEFGYQIKNDRIFGWGERVTPGFQLCSDRDDYCVYTTFNKDSASPLDKGDPPGGKNIYGHQPFYMVQQKSNNFYGVLLLNSNDQDLVVVKKPNNILNLYHKPIGGIFDFYFFYSGTAHFIMKKYHSFIGKPYLPAFWSLGYHQCRYGWHNISKVKDVIAKLEQYDIPLETLWIDIDYMDHYRDFTVDNERFKGLGDFVADLHRKTVKFVPIIDAGIFYNPEDPYFKKGEEKGAYIKSAYTKKSLCGRVWPGITVFPDWYHPYMTTHWHNGLAYLYTQVEFDGIWIDMNEAANFVKGECDCPKSSLRIKQVPRQDFSDPHDPHEFDNLPYQPGNCDPNDKALSMSGYHYAENDFEDKVRKEYNTHSLFGLYESIATQSFLSQKQNKRPFVLTRANFPGSGLFTSLWLGDNYSAWEYMRYSVIGMYSYQMFGMPLVGADMCGFMGNTNEELCARWMQMGSFYPFSRNHNDIHSNDQEPYVWGEKVAMSSRNALRQKYSILRYFYTKLFEVSLDGGALVYPLYFDHPEDPTTFEKAPFMWMIGPALLVAPVLHPGLDHTWPYISNENWFDLRTKGVLHEYDPKQQYGKQIELAAPWDYVNVLVQGGNILPFQDALGNKVRRTAHLQILPLEIIIAPDHEGKAEGTMIVDDDSTINPIESKEYRHYQFSFSMNDNKLSVNMKHEYKTTYLYEKVKKLHVLGAQKWSNYNSACINMRDGSKVSAQLSYTESLKLLTMKEPGTTKNWNEVDYIIFGQTC